MLAKKIKIFISLIFLLINLFYTNIQNASEIVIFADNINYDNKKNNNIRNNEINIKRYC